MKRLDMSDYLVHWVSGKTREEALNSLCSIIVDGKIYGSTNIIKGGYSCVCFTEAPIEHFNFDTSRYWPFGISISKRSLFAQGGRPVIYQSDVEFCALPEYLRWRHVRYEPNTNPPIDFTWEREWRVQIEEFYLEPENICIIVPDKETETELICLFEESEQLRYQYERIGYGKILARTPEPWIYLVRSIKNN